MHLLDFIKPDTLIKTFGLLGIFAVIFAESGLMIGFFLPGDSLLFTAGFLASQGLLDINGVAGSGLPVLIIGCAIAAIVGDSVGYSFGRRVGRRLFQRDDNILFHKKNIEYAERFYQQNGPKTIILARFTPIVRTFAPIVAGIGTMEYKTFLTFNVIGGILWSVGLNLVGFFLGGFLKNQLGVDVDAIILPIVIIIIIVSLLPTILHVMRDEEMRTGIMNAGRQIISRRRVDGVSAAPTIKPVINEVDPHQ